MTHSLLERLNKIRSLLLLDSILSTYIQIYSDEIQHLSTLLYIHDFSMYAAKDNMNLPVNKSWTPLPSSPTPKFSSPAGTKRHHGEGTAVRPTDLLVDRNKRSPRNDPRALDHVGSQNQAQQIIESASSNIEHSGKATALHCAQRRYPSIGSTKSKHRL